MTRTGDLHPALFRPQAVAAETRRVNAGLVACNSLPAEACPARVDIYESAASGASPSRLRVIAGPRPRGVYLHIPGGDWVMGGPARRDAMLARIGANTGMACISVDYRRGPVIPTQPAGRLRGRGAVADRPRARPVRHHTARHRRRLDRRASRRHHPVAPADAGHGRSSPRPASPSASTISGLTPSARAATGGLTDRRRIGKIADDFVPAGLDRRHPDISPLHADLRGLPPVLSPSARWMRWSTTRCSCMPAGSPPATRRSWRSIPGGVHGFTALPGQLSARSGRADRRLPRPAPSVRSDRWEAA
jgi:acetyl esterase